MAKESEATLLLKIKTAGEEALSRTKDALGAIASKAAVVGTALVGFIGAGIKAYQEQEEATNKLNQSMVQQGVYTSDLSKKYNEYAASLQKTSVFGDEVTLTAISNIQSFIGQTQVTEGLIKATADFASAMGVDLETASQLVGKSIGTNTNGLARYGIELDTSASESEKLAAVTEALNSKFGGQAEAATQGLGALIVMKNAVGDLAEVVGQQFAPLIIEISNNIKDFALEVQTNSQALEGLAETAKFVGQVFVVLKNATFGLVEVLSTGLSGAVSAVRAAMELNFEKVKEVTSLATEEIKNTIVSRAQQTSEELAEIDGLELERKAEVQEQEAVLIEESNIRKQELNMLHLEEIDRQNKEKEVKDKEAFLLRAQENIALIGADNKQRLALMLKRNADELKAATDNATKMRLLQQREDLLNQVASDRRKELEETRNREKIQNQKGTFSTISTLSSSNNKTLAAIGKAAGITQIAIETPVAVARALSAFPPPFNFIAAGVVGVAMAAQAARIAGVQLAEGGIVKATTGGVPAIIGEGGRDEAVIPLGKGGGAAMGTTINLVVYGGLLGDASSAKELAVALDAELFKLRKSNESIAFDTGII